MPRTPRKKSRTGIYHIVFRGVNRQTIFEDEQDKRVFLRTLAKFKEKSSVELYGYCLMDNHVHLLVKETEESISDFMKRVSSSYVYWYNAKYKRCGHLFQGRFYSESVEDAKYFVTALRYIHQNPLKAGLVRSVWDSKWTSVHEYVRKRRIVDIDKGLSLFSPDRKVALTRYSDFMERENDDQCLEVHERVTLSDDEVREYFRKVGVVSSSMLQQMERSERNALLAKVKQVDGVSIRQLSRVTGISKSVIARV